MKERVSIITIFELLRIELRFVVEIIIIKLNATNVNLFGLNNKKKKEFFLIR